MHQPLHPLNIGLDVAAGAITAAAFMNWLPPIAAALSIVWLTIQIGTWALAHLKKDKK